MDFFKRVTDRAILNAPVIVKSTTETAQLIAQYQQALKNSTDEKHIQQLMESIKKLKLMQKDEQSVLEELLSSSLPMHVLQDVRIVHNDRQCRLDFIVVTRKFILLIRIENTASKNKVISLSKGSSEACQSSLQQIELFKAYFKNLKVPIKNVVVFTKDSSSKDANPSTTEKTLHVTSLVEYIKKELAKPSSVLFRDLQLTEISNSIKAAHSVQ